MTQSKLQEIGDGNWFCVICEKEESWNNIEIKNMNKYTLEQLITGMVNNLFSNKITIRMSMRLIISKLYEIKLYFEV